MSYNHFLLIETFTKSFFLAFFVLNHFFYQSHFLFLFLVKPFFISNPFWYNFFILLHWFHPWIYLLFPFWRINSSQLSFRMFNFSSVRSYHCSVIANTDAEVVITRTKHVTQPRIRPRPEWEGQEECLNDTTDLKPEGNVERIMHRICYFLGNQNLAKDYRSRT